MPEVTQQECIEQFLASWQGLEGYERVNYPDYFGDLCIALEAERPPPQGTIAGDRSLV
ncbi:hypothetical protein VZG28_09290 [Synechococcus elongatus IITB4]|uniref:hypothetical protein n=1 Tax=Synechococcus elongatus TaxID=32046 RepID=UPI0030CFD681